MDFDGKIAVVTGAGSGIGLATARALFNLGATIVPCVVNEAQRANVSDYERAQVFDVRDEAGWSRTVEACERDLGGIDVLVNNAGVILEGTAEETDLAMWDTVLDINLKGTFLGCRAVIPAIRRRGGGAIVNLSSIDALKGGPRHVAYSASKGGIAAMTRTLAVDHAHENIRINAVCPGAVQTPLFDKVLTDSGDYDAVRKRSMAKHPMGRIGEPDEIADVIVFLCGPGARFMTGQSVSIDGGRNIL